MREVSSKSNPKETTHVELMILQDIKKVGSGSHRVQDVQHEHFHCCRKLHEVKDNKNDFGAGILEQLLTQYPIGGSQVEGDWVTFFALTKSTKCGGIGRRKGRPQRDADQN
ncbi:hypothetical protein PIB30_025268 [Stylosanthes scabra]|uniref:Uncharacterized protein n=1 Tax=Stylosanthes scabra TaxID=79078 RepID=A0ABU6T9R1_9FABA|nr:hypothetical protein [Stylosanthes scabra]